MSATDPFQPDDTNPLAAMLARLTDGGSFILDSPAEAVPVWGEDSEVLWAEGEPFILTGTSGVGKTTVMQQVVLSRIGLGGAVLGYPVAPAERVLYLAMDRPRQIARSFRRMVIEDERDTLTQRLVVWPGPPPADIARHPSILLELARLANADCIIVDSLKDAAIGLTNDEVGAGVNRSFQTCVSSGVDLGILHHQTKRSGSGDGGKPIALADVYGSAWITNGAGSVILLHGDAGAETVRLIHLKPAVDIVGPLDLEHDHHAGVTRLHDGHVDALEWLRRQRGPVTASQLAAARDPNVSKTEVERARRDLKRLTRNGLANEQAAAKGGHGGSTPATWTARASEDHAPLWQAS